MRINLTGGAYQASGLIEAAQRCVNLYPEYIPAAQGEVAQATHLPTPGLVELLTLPTTPVRGLYAASTGHLFAVGGACLYYVAPDLTVTFIATITTAVGPVAMADNGQFLVLVDGSARGLDPYSFAGGIQVDLATRTPDPMPTEDDGFYGADRVDYVATFLVFNRPGTATFYTSEAGTTTFNPTAYALKAGAADALTAAVIVSGNLLLVGAQTSEPWALTISPDLPTPFQPMGGAIIEHGCSTPGSIAVADGAVFLLSQNRQGRGIVLRMQGGQSRRISTHAIEAAIAGYVDQDVRGFCYQFLGHVFYVLAFVSATWVYDLVTEQWHQWVSTVADGRHRAACFASAYGRSVVGDRVAGTLYELRSDAYTDADVSIERVRSFPHLVSSLNRVSYSRLIADMTAGQVGDVSLRWSNDRGATFNAPMVRSMGADAAATSLQFWRLGMARDRVFELSWNAAGPIALNGAFVDVEESAA